MAMPRLLRVFDTDGQLFDLGDYAGVKTGDLRFLCRSRKIGSYTEVDALFLSGTNIQFVPL